MLMHRLDLLLALSSAPLPNKDAARWPDAPQWRAVSAELWSYGARPTIPPHPICPRMRPIPPHSRIFPRSTHTHMPTHAHACPRMPTRALTHASHGMPPLHTTGALDKLMGLLANPNCPPPLLPISVALLADWCRDERQLRELLTWRAPPGVLGKTLATMGPAKMTPATMGGTPRPRRIIVPLAPDEPRVAPCCRTRLAPMRPSTRARLRPLPTLWPLPCPLSLSSPASRPRAAAGEGRPARRAEAPPARLAAAAAAAVGVARAAAAEQAPRRAHARGGRHQGCMPTTRCAGGAQAGERCQNNCFGARNNYLVSFSDSSVSRS